MYILFQDKSKDIHLPRLFDCYGSILFHFTLSRVKLFLNNQTIRQFENEKEIVVINVCLLSLLWHYINTAWNWETKLSYLILQQDRVMVFRGSNAEEAMELNIKRVENHCL